MEMNKEMKKNKDKSFWNSSLVRQEQRKGRTQHALGFVCPFGVRSSSSRAVMGTKRDELGPL